MRKLLAVVALAVTALAACGGDDDSDGGGTEIAGVAEYEDLSNKHADGALEYPQSPPVGGAHNARWMRCDTYSEPVPDEFVVHSLEHGAVWITYRPGLAAADVAALVKLRDVRAEKVLVSPYTGQTSPVVATAWGLQLKVDSATDPRLEQFTKAYVDNDRGGEAGADCANGLTLDQAHQLMPSHGSGG